ncbi:MAG: hypothetical protein JST75_20895 [Bacteroidetes bacterium]|nr:hypothetical protein [Bacteroidota bacterium]
MTTNSDGKEVTARNQEVANMEVHHHPDIHHKPKKWKEYFLEFLMIFLAVTLGFIAENLREHITERAKEKQHIEGFIRNVKDDTALLHHVIVIDERQVRGVDSMLALAHVNMDIDSNRKSFYHFVYYYFFNSSSFKSNDATLQQLKSTGDYRLIERDHVADSLTKYDRDIHDIYSEGAYYESYFKENLSRLEDIIDVTIFTDTSFIKNGKLSNKPFPKLRSDNEKLPTFFNKVFDFRMITNAYAENYLKLQLESSKRLIAFLKEKYDIEE